MKDSESSDVDIKRRLRKEEEKGKGGHNMLVSFIMWPRRHGSFGTNFTWCCFWVWCVRMLAPLVRSWFVRLGHTFRLANGVRP